MSIDPRHLVQLAAILEAGSFTEAAQRLALAQSALSRNMKTLERVVGAPVLLRGRRGATATELGVTLARYGEVIRAAGRNAATATTSIGSGEVRQVTIAATSLISEFCLVEPLATFMTANPGVACHVRVGLIEDLVTMAALGEADLAIGHFGALTGAEGVQYERLLDDWLTVFGRPGHPLAGARDARALVAAGARWVLPEARNRLRWEIEAALRYVGVDRIELAVESGTTSPIIRILQASDCVAMLPRFALMPLLARGELVELCPNPAMPRRPIGIISQAERRNAPLVTAFLRGLRRAARSSRTKKNGGPDTLGRR